ILDTPVRCNGPALDCVHMIEQRPALEGAALGNELLMGGLRVTCLVGRAALNHRWLAVPDPWETESRLADRQHRILQRCEIPALTLVCRNLDPRDLAATAPGEPSDLVKPWSRQFHFARREGDHGFRFHSEGKYARLADRGDGIGVFRCLFA